MRGKLTYREEVEKKCMVLYIIINFSTSSCRPSLACVEGKGEQVKGELAGTEN